MSELRRSVAGSKHIIGSVADLFDAADCFLRVASYARKDGRVLLASIRTFDDRDLKLRRHVERAVVKRVRYFSHRAIFEAAKGVVILRMGGRLT